MTQKVENLVDSYYSDSIELEDSKLLIADRVREFRGTKYDAVSIRLEDADAGTSIYLAEYFCGKWKFSTPRAESIFWSTVKPNYQEFKKIFSKLRSSVPNATGLEYRVRANQLKKMAQFKSPMTVLTDLN